jgi:hypothetical protein
MGGNRLQSTLAGSQSKPSTHRPAEQRARSTPWYCAQTDAPHALLGSQEAGFSPRRIAWQEQQLFEAQAPAATLKATPRQSWFTVASDIRTTALTQGSASQNTFAAAPAM